MPRQKGIFWEEYDLVSDSLEEVEKYQYKHCKTKYVKNASRLQTHLEKCTSYQIKLAEEEATSSTQNNNTIANLKTKRQRFQAYIDRFTYKYSENDQKLIESLLARGFYSAGISFNVIENEDIKAIFQKGLPWFKIPSRYRLSNSLLNQEYIKIKQLIEIILNESEYFSTLHRLQNEIYNKYISLLLPGETRWRSVFYAAENLLKTKTAIQRLTLEDNIKISDKIKNEILSDIFWHNLKALCDFLLPFAIFLKKLQNDQPTLSIAYSELCKLKISISENTEVSEDFRTNSINKGTDRWKNFLYNPAIILAYKLDPDIKAKP
ncbi:538_t:CDS:2 [Dentiscutata erythropus]|uniref:538_t:CDS:1 n=1 Tax=Dentiscutata erythropus TaxID=1348616 RepID=A0A9N9EKB7_9GLOM|nr:538_t:CDS:2 [Dentiscutata erythropus]